MKPFRPLHRVLILALVACASLALPTIADAQALYGSITGTVTDNTGATIPGVTVTVTNEGTGLKLDTVTDAEGLYTVRNVLPGTYTLHAALQGFKTFAQTGIPLTAGNILRVNATLEIGALTESITVTTEAALLKTDKADVSVELQPKAITDMPLNQYRNYQALMNLVPGATPGAFQNSTGSTPQRSLRTFVNGTNPNNNSTRIDGAASINVWLPHHAGMVASAETIDNVNIVTNNFDADTGMAGGAAIAVVTKSGTNSLRGSAFIFQNRDEWNANTYFNNANKLTKPPVTASIYGGTVGGPIVKNRLFYFGSYERFNEERGPAGDLLGADRADAAGRLQRDSRGRIPTSASTTRRRVTPRATVARSLPVAVLPCQPDQQHRQEDPGHVSDAEHDGRPQRQPHRRRLRRAARTAVRPAQLRREGVVEPLERAPDLGQDLVPRLRTVDDRFQLGFDQVAPAPTEVDRAGVRSHVDAVADADPRRQLRRDARTSRRVWRPTTAPTGAARSGASLAPTAATSVRAASRSSPPA